MEDDSCMRGKHLIQTFFFPGCLSHYSALAITDLAFCVLHFTPSHQNPALLLEVLKCDLTHL